MITKIVERIGTNRIEKLGAVALAVLVVISIVPLGTALADNSRTSESDNLTEVSTASSYEYQTDFTEYPVGSIPSDWMYNYGSNATVAGNNSIEGDRSL